MLIDEEDWSATVRLVVFGGTHSPLPIPGSSLLEEGGFDTVAMVALQLASSVLTAVFEPVQLHVYAVELVATTGVVVVALHRPVVGITLNVWPDELPHVPYVVVGSTGAT